MHRPFLAALVALALAGGVAPAPASAEIDRRRFRDRNCNVELSVPTDWIPTEQASFPGLLLVAIHVDSPSRMTLAAARTAIDADAGKLAEVSRASLAELGYRLPPARQNPTGAFVMSGSTRDGRERLWQAYRVHAGVLYILTLAAPANRAQASALAFGDALRTLIHPMPDVPGPACAIPRAAAPPP